MKAFGAIALLAVIVIGVVLGNQYMDDLSEEQSRRIAREIFGMETSAVPQVPVAIGKAFDETTTSSTEGDIESEQRNDQRDGNDGNRVMKSVVAGMKKWWDR